MFRIPSLCGSQATYSVRSFGLVYWIKNSLLCFSVRPTRHPCNSLANTSSSWSIPRLYFLRGFKVCSCSLTEWGSNDKGEGSFGRVRESDVGKNSEDDRSTANFDSSLNSENLIQRDIKPACYSGRIAPVTEFLGIEVFPEIFDKLSPKCSGCGAVLQSDYEGKPGYIPENRNPSLSRTNEENAFMTEIICFRCFSIKHYNKDLPPVVSPEAISKFLMHISCRKALILYNVDIMDIPGSFVPNILEIVGETKHLILVCNKVDRLAVDGHPHTQIERMKKIVCNEAMNFGLENANVKDVCMISAKTGLGVRDLVKKINMYWRKNSDVYIVGSNNTGKTTLFNLLADLFAASRQSDDMLQRGTVSVLPGTTLSLLRFPISHHRFLRVEDRLQHGYSESKEKSKVQLHEVDLDEQIIDKEMTKYRDLEVRKSSMSSVPSVYRPQFVTKRNKDNINWLYDTPGLYSQNQVTHFLTIKELKLLNPALWIVPRTFILKPGKVLLFGGLARLDYLDVKRLSRPNQRDKEDVPKASQSIFFTVFTSPNLPIHVTSLERADIVYEEHAGTEVLKIPSGGRERMKEFPSLTGRIMEVTGVDWKRSAADIVLSNVGWVAVTAGTGSVVTVKAYTPKGNGLFLRDPPLLPTSVRQRGRRGMPYLGHVNHSMYQGTRKRSPSLAKFLVEENVGTAQWMKVAEKKRKQQRLMLKFEKTKWHSKKKIGFSAKSVPTKYLADYEDYPELEDGRATGSEGSN